MSSSLVQKDTKGKTEKMLLYHRTHSGHFGKQNIKPWTNGIIHFNVYTPRYGTLCRSNELRLSIIYS